MQLVIALISGLIFGLSLILSGMTNPAKVLSFLDLAGNWGPSLAFVMAGALLIGSFAFPYALKRPTAFMGDEFRVPKVTHIDRRLVLGGLTFGVGWGLGRILSRTGIGISTARSSQNTPVFYRDAGWHGYL